MAPALSSEVVREPGAPGNLGEDTSEHIPIQGCLCSIPGVLDIVFLRVVRVKITVAKIIKELVTTATEHIL